MSKFSIYVATNTDTSECIEGQDVLDRFRNACVASPSVSLVDDPQAASMVVLFERHAFKTQRDFAAFRSCPFILEYLDRLYVVNKDSRGHALLPGLYTSLNRNDGSSGWYRPVCYYVSQNPILYSYVDISKQEPPEWLASFRGNPKSHPVRHALAKILANESDIKVVLTDTWISHPHDAMKAYAEEIIQSKFVLCPRGISPNSHRIFETMALGRCPVIISDNWNPPRRIKWDQCSFSVKENDLGSLAGILRKNEHLALEFGDAAQYAWNRFFAPEKLMDYYLSELIDIAIHLPAGDQRRKAIHGWWRSRRVLWRNGWSFEQRLFRRCCKSFNGIFRK